MSNNDFTIALTGLEACLKSLDAALAASIQAATTSVNETCLLVETDAKRLCPVGTPESTHKKGYKGGRLRSSIHTTRAVVDGETLQGKVSTNVTYALPVEMGTYKMAAQPYLHPAFRKNIPKFVKRLQARMQAALQQ